MIVFDKVSKTYGKSNVGLKDVSVSINPGEFVFLVGPNGAGKSTFIKLIMKEIDADSGRILVNGRDVTKLSAREIPRHRRSIGIVFQDFRLLPKKTIFENVAFAMEIIHSSQREIQRQVPLILSLVGISEKADKYPDELSVGQQQRVAIARAIVNNPMVLIADEPTGNLDPETSWEIMQLLYQINLRGTTVVMVTHAKDIVNRMRKRVITIQDGRVVHDNVGIYVGANPANAVRAAKLERDTKAIKVRREMEARSERAAREKEGEKAAEAASEAAYAEEGSEPK